MAFMRPETWEGSAWEVNTSVGTERISFDESEPDLSNLEGKPDEGQDPILVKGWWARLTAPGYLDCTDTMGPYETEEEAMAELHEVYGDSETGELEGCDCPECEAASGEEE